MKKILMIMLAVAFFTQLSASSDYLQGWNDALVNLNIEKPEKDYHALKNINRIQIIMVSTSPSDLDEKVKNRVTKILKKEGIEILRPEDNSYTTHEASLLISLSGKENIRASLKLVQKGYFLREVEGEYKFYQGVATTWNSPLFENPKEVLAPWIEKELSEFLSEWHKANDSKASS